MKVKPKIHVKFQRMLNNGNISKNTKCTALILVDLKTCYKKSSIENSADLGQG